TSSELRITVFGRPVSMSRPRTSACTSSRRSKAEPTSSLISSAVCWPTSSLYSVLMCWMIASSISSPPTRMLWLTTMPPSEMIAGALVDRDDRGLAENDPPSSDVDQGICGAEIDRHVAASEPGHGGEDPHCPAPSLATCWGKVAARHVAPPRPPCERSSRPGG